MTNKESPKPNARLLKISWTFFGAGASCAIGALLGWEAVHNDEKAADWGTFFATLLGLLLPSIGLFLRNLAHGRISRLSAHSHGVYGGDDGVSGGDGMSGGD